MTALRLFAALALVCVTLFSQGVDARQRHRTYAADPNCNVTMPCEGVAPSARGELVVKAMHGFGSARKVYTPRAEIYSPTRVSGIVGPLAAKVSEIQSSCGSRVISGIRHTYIAGTRHISLHASGKAVDMAGYPGCIYAHLAGWQGGYSTDYARMAHVHISLDAEGGREMGLAFRHGGGRRHAHRHHHQRMTSRQ